MYFSSGDGLYTFFKCMIGGDALHAKAKLPGNNGGGKW